MKTSTQKIRKLKFERCQFSRSMDLQIDSIKSQPKSQQVFCPLGGT